MSDHTNETSILGQAIPAMVPRGRDRAWHKLLPSNISNAPLKSKAWHHKLRYPWAKLLRPKQLTATHLCTKARAVENNIAAKSRYSNFNSQPTVRMKRKIMIRRLSPH